MVFKNHITRTSLMTETLAKASEFAYLGLNDRVRRSIIPIQVRWFPPTDNWFKLNSDGSSMGNPGRAGGGGIIRNFQGDWPDWVSGYARAIGYTTSVTAELWALRDGINLCIESSLTNVLIELDAKIVVDMLKKNEGSSNSNDIILADCKEGLQKIPKVQIQHCYREANKCANALARRAAMLSQDFVIFQFPAEVALLV